MKETGASDPATTKSYAANNMTFGSIQREADQMVSLS